MRKTRSTQFDKPLLKRLERLRSGRMTRIQPKERPQGAAPALIDPVSWIPGFRKQWAAPLEKLSILSIHDLLTHFPRDYCQRRPLTNLEHGVQLMTQGEIISAYSQRTRGRGARLCEVTIEDRGASIKVPFFQPNLGQMMQAGRWLRVIGTVDYSYGGFSLRPAHFEVLNDPPEAIKEDDRHLVPVYPLTAKITNTSITKLVRKALKSHGHLLEPLVPEEISEKHQLMPMAEAIHQIHFPMTPSHLNAARVALKFREFFMLEAGLALKQQKHKQGDDDLIFQFNDQMRESCDALMPFTLTNAQQRVVGEIAKDLTSPGRMHRLLQGDVGSGKTAVAAYVAKLCMENGFQAALIAPTEILARQHAQRLGELFASSGDEVALLTGGMEAGERAEILLSLRTGRCKLVVGTHALLQQDVEFKDLALVIFDEQHKFGVRQRAQLFAKGNKPHRLAMSATPIPRTLSLTVFGDLDVSVIDELPPGRKPVDTQWFPMNARGQVLQRVRERLDQGDQVYFVEPLVESNPNLEVHSAKDRFKELKATYPDVEIELVHGQMNREEKAERMHRFVSGEARILVATVVIEVGVDVPEANVMVIGNAERFGLAQLHQLRGRIGRGTRASALYLVADATTPESIARLNALRETSDGFEIAEIDLRLRGFGDFVGTRQAGMPRLKLADPVADMKMLAAARNAAFDNIDQLDPRVVRATIRQTFGSGFDIVDG